MLISKCHNAKPWFLFGVVHGVVLNKKNQFVGKCSKCHKDTIFKKRLTDDRWLRETHHVLRGGY